MKKIRSGFTLVEVMIVVAIMSIVAAVMVPAVMTLRERGNQTNRANIARTIYLAAQNQMTRYHNQKTLKENMTGFYFDDFDIRDGVATNISQFIDKLHEDRISVNNVNNALGGDTEDGIVTDNFPIDEDPNLIRFVSKPAGWLPGQVVPGQNLDVLNGFYELLDSIIIDKTILNNAILMEYNIRTGVILSIFYGDGEQTEFVYNDNNNDINNIRGGRHGAVSNGYNDAIRRRQGYYGVESTGLPFDPMIREIVNIYDGADRPLAINGAEERENVLYAEFLVPSAGTILRPGGLDNYNLDIFSREDGTITTITAGNVDLNVYGTDFLNSIERQIDGILPIYHNYCNDDICFHDDSFTPRVIYYGVDIGGYFDRYIWVIDYVGEDMFRRDATGTSFNIGDNINIPQWLGVAITRDGGDRITSLSEAHSHFSGDLSDGSFQIRTARHLNNIRYWLDGTFRQINENVIDMQKPGNEISNFIPIGLTYDNSVVDIPADIYNFNPFTGNYFAFDDAKIDNLQIDMSVHFASTHYGGTNPINNVGLFAHVQNGTIDGLVLENPEITAKESGLTSTANNVGVIAGFLENGVISNSNVIGATIRARDVPNVGGLVGSDTEGTINVSEVINSIITASDAINVGGLVGNKVGGTDGGSITSGVFFNSHIEAENAINVGGLVGQMNNSSIRLSYSYANVFGGNGNTGGLVGLVSDAASVINESFNAGFFNAIADSETRDGIGAIIATGGNIGGLVGSNNGTIRNSFNNARVNIDDVLINANFNSIEMEETPLDLLSASIAFLGGIAGDNSVTGIIERTYATNYVANYIVNRSGGIVGNNSNPALANNNNFRNYYLTNGTNSNIGEARDKAWLQNVGASELGSSFGTAATGRFDDGNNIYANYPYPVLATLNPIPMSWSWGWEDIFVNPMGDAYQLIYYEIYPGNRFGYADGSSEMGSLSVPEEPHKENKDIVLNDGYLLEFDLISGVSAAEMDVTIGLQVYKLKGVKIGATWDWSESTITDSQPVFINTIPNDDGEEFDRFRIFFTNAFLEGHGNGEEYIVFRIDVVDEMHFITRFNPLFANTVEKPENNQFSVRSPRHLHNISEALASIYTQELHLDFETYRNELADPNADDPEPSTDKDVEQNFNDAVVKDKGVDVDTGLPRPFTGSYNGLFNNIRYEIRNVVAVNGLFAEIGATPNIENITTPNAITVSTIINLTLVNSQFNGNGTIGGIAAINRGFIYNSVVKGIPVTTSESSHTSRITSSDMGDCGGIAGVNYGKIILSNVENTFIAGATYSGGAAGINRGLIEFCVNQNNQVSLNNTAGGAHGVGGISGINHGAIKQSAVHDTPATPANPPFKAVVGIGDSVHVGGIVGINAPITDVSNTGIVEDIFFLSTADLALRPISDNGGGIVGWNNEGRVARALYLAPSPQEIRNISGTDTILIYPIIRSGTPAAKKDTIIDGEPRSFETCFYLAGHRYSLNEGRSWINERYNLTRLNLLPPVHCVNGGSGKVTKFLDVQWLEYAYRADLSNWRQITSANDDYPYPALNLPVSRNWPETDSPARPDQVDRDDWDIFNDVNLRAISPNFVNGTFAGSYTASQAIELVDNATNSRRIYIDMDHVAGWFTRPVSASLEGTATNWRWMELQEPINIANYNQLHSYAYSDYRGRFKSTGTGTGANALNTLNSEFRYAELNADVQGTLYQVLPTTPGAQFYYSFYHTSRTGTASGSMSDRMNFYLSPIDDNATIAVTTNAQRDARDAAMVMIRPCITPRTNRTAVVPNDRAWNSTLWNPAAWNTVAYGSSTATLANGYNNYNLSYHNGRGYLQPSGEVRVQNIPERHIPGSPIPDSPIYLYDVWIGPAVSGTGDNAIRPADGYGITFWSTVNATISSSGLLEATYQALITGAPAVNDGTTNITFPTNTTLRRDIVNNVIGYWGVEYGWKHYYGMYEVPEDQLRTEFAFQSGRNDAQNGNYLDGISFKTAPFLSIDKMIKDKDNREVTYVKPGDSLTVELNVVAYGDIPADRIVITDQIAPFNQYLDFNTASANVRVRKNGLTVTGANIAYLNDIVTITLPTGVTLASGDRLIVEFDIKVRDRVLLDDITETLLYYFRNQASVSFCEDSELNTNKLTAYTRSNINSTGNTRASNKVNRNGSGIVLAHIDPIRLDKTVTPLIGRDFNIKLTVENTLAAGNTLQTNGLINDVVPRGFVLTTPVYKNGVQVPVLTSPNPDGSTRVTIWDVNIGGATKQIDYTYSLSYIGNGYGVAYTNSIADYKYIYDGGNDEEPLSVMLRFPQPVVGIPIITRPDYFVINDPGGIVANTHVLNITANDNFDSIIDGVLRTVRLADDNYNVTPEVRLTDSAGNPMPKRDENYYIGPPLNDGLGYTAELARGTNNLQFTPSLGVPGIYTLYYQIYLEVKKAGGVLDEVILSSDVTPITIVVTADPPEIEVTTEGLDDLVWDEEVDDAKFIYTLTNGLYAPDLNDDFLIDTINNNLPEGLLAETPERVNNFTVEVAITGTPESAGTFDIILPIIGKENVVGASEDIIPTGTVTIEVDVGMFMMLIECDDPDCDDPDCLVHGIECDDPDCDNPDCPIHRIECNDPDCVDLTCPVHGDAQFECDDPDCAKPDCPVHGEVPLECVDPDCSTPDCPIHNAVVVPCDDPACTELDCGVHGDIVYVDDNGEVPGINLESNPPPDGSPYDGEGPSGGLDSLNVDNDAMDNALDNLSTDYYDDTFHSNMHDYNIIDISGVVDYFSIDGIVGKRVNFISNMVKNIKDISPRILRIFVFTWR